MEGVLSSQVKCRFQIKIWIPDALGELEASATLLISCHHLELWLRPGHTGHQR
jgi:hypothetical protein